MQEAVKSKGSLKKDEEGLESKDEEAKDEEETLLKEADLVDINGKIKQATKN